SLAQRGRVKRLVSGAIAQRDALAQDALVADDAVAVDDDRALVFNHDSSAERYRVGQLDAVVIAHMPKEKAIDHTEHAAHRLEANAHAPHAETVHRHCTKARPGPVAPVRCPVLANLSKQARPAVT